VEAAKINLEAVSQGLVQHGIDLVRDINLAWVDFAFAQHREKAMSLRIWILLLVFFATLSARCGGSGRAVQAPATAPPAKVHNGGVKEADLANIVLTPQAEQRLGLETVPASLGRVARRRTLAGEVVLPPSRSQTVSSPVAGTLLANGTAPAAGLRVEKG